MAATYANIKRFQLELLNRNTAHLREFLVASERLAELMIFGLERLPRRSTGNEEGDPRTSIVTVWVRMFNDFEAAKICALRGLADQATGPIRDTIECMLLLRLFIADPKAAARWLTHGNEYTPGDVHATLAKRGIATPEYAMYGVLSARSHPNLMGSLATAKETNHGGGLITVEWGIGGCDRPWFTRTALVQVCLFQLLAVIGPLADLHARHFSTAESEAWRAEVREVHKLVRPLLPEADTRDPADAEGVKIAIAKLERKVERSELGLLVEMKKLFGEDFSFD